LTNPVYPKLCQSRIITHLEPTNHDILIRKGDCLMRLRFAVIALVLAFLPPSTSRLLAVPSFSAWGTPLNLGAVVNSPSTDGGPCISKDGLSLYFHSNRPGSMGDTDIWVSQRANLDDPWGSPVNLGPTVNTSSAETVPTFSRDGHWMFFASTRLGGFGGNDVWASWRKHTHDDFAWGPPMNLGPNINTAFFDGGPSYFAGDGIPLLLFSSNKPGGFGQNDVYASELLSDGSFGPATHISELNSHGNDARPAVRHDGLEIFLFSSRVGSFGLNDLYASTRPTVGSTWALPENLGPVINTAAEEQFPQLSSDGKKLLFASNRSGGFGGFDLYMTARSKPGR
jgi:WD40 repeat protein